MKCDLFFTDVWHVFTVDFFYSTPGWSGMVLIFKVNFMFATSCSMSLRLVAEKADDQLPLWFVSHAWLEPIILFLACLRRHASIRELSGQALAPPAYWVCAYANNQHVLEDAISENPRKTSFYKAMQLCYGVLLVLDSNATPFSRIWCCFEESIAVQHLIAHFMVSSRHSRHSHHRSQLPPIGLFSQIMSTCYQLILSHSLVRFKLQHVKLKVAPTRSQLCCGWIVVSFQCHKSHTEVEERDSNNFLLDVAATDTPVRM